MTTEKIIGQEVVIENGKAVEVTTIERRRILSKKQIEAGIEQGVKTLQKFAEINEKLLDAQ